MEHKIKRKITPHMIYIGILILIMLVAIVFGVVAKYIQQRKPELLAKARMFYFTSDFLKEEGASYSLKPNTTQVTFNLKNHIDELRYSDDDVNYKVYLNDVEIGNGVFDEEKTSKEFTFSVENGKTYQVRAEGEAGYKKTLTATFVVMDPSRSFYKHLDASNEHFVILTVWTEDISGDVKVTFPAGLIPDTTDDKLKDVLNYVDGQYVSATTPTSTELQTYSSFSYRFFREDLESMYTVNDFTVTMDDEITAIVGTP